MSTAMTWLDDLKPSIPRLSDTVWEEWRRLDSDLTSIKPNDPGCADQRKRSAWLCDVRRELISHRPVIETNQHLWQAGAQFLAGYVDLDLREATGVGHGAMITTHAPRKTAHKWERRLAYGDLVGIAATEAHGGSRVQEITTAAHSDGTDVWRINGEKCWVSRLTEASAFVVFIRDPKETISAVVVDAEAPGLTRTAVDPAGLGGWSWGLLQFDDVPVDLSTNLLGRRGDGLGIFRSHFAMFRPLVTACALGAAASVHDRVGSLLVAKRRSGAITRVRDHALIDLGAAWADITAAFLLVLHAVQTNSTGRCSDLIARLGKAHGVDVASDAVNRLAPLIGAVAFQRTHPIMKARLDLTALQYADGIHDSLYRSGGSEILRNRPVELEDATDLRIAA